MDFRKTIYYLGWVMSVCILGYFVLIAAMNDSVEITWGGIVLVGLIMFMVLMWYRSTIDDF